MVVQHPGIVLKVFWKRLAWGDGGFSWLYLQCNDVGTIWAVQEWRLGQKGREEPWVERRTWSCIKTELDWSSLCTMGLVSMFVKIFHNLWHFVSIYIYFFVIHSRFICSNLTVYKTKLTNWKPSLRQVRMDLNIRAEIYIHWNVSYKLLFFHVNLKTLILVIFSQQIDKIMIRQLQFVSS